MTREDFINNGIDYDAAMKLFMGKQEIFVKFLAKFPKDTSYSQLKDAVAAGDCDAAFKAAHTLKGVSGNLSLADLAKVASDITELFRAGDLEGGKAHMAELDGQYERVMEFLGKL
ncbi:MAG: Hpt domain-containing protein [Lachnospiraceae bacterium]|nr:Hpt domain-containing protein [Lachnospiraceae bacterium]